MFGFLWRKQPNLPAQSYNVFTREFDFVTTAEDLLRELPNPTAKARSLHRELEHRRSQLDSTERWTEALCARWRAGHSLGDRPLITLLIDHSGSMRGPKSLAAAMVAKVLGEIFEREGIAFEVLGYTTVSWRGGDSRSAWISRGRRPKNPGRLCDLLHIIHQDAQAPSPSWSDGLMTLLTQHLLKENVDGEALEWAQQRAQVFEPTSWVCIVLSDGAPVDDSTIDANRRDTSFLPRHLNQVIEKLESQPNVRLGAIGLAYAVDQYYSASRKVTNYDQSIELTLSLLEELIWRAELV